MARIREGKTTHSYLTAACLHGQTLMAKLSELILIINEERYESIVCIWRVGLTPRNAVQFMGNTTGPGKSRRVPFLG